MYTPWVLCELINFDSELGLACVRARVYVCACEGMWLFHFGPLPTGCFECPLLWLALVNREAKNDSMKLVRDSSLWRSNAIDGGLEMNIAGLVPTHAQGPCWVRM
jgi:hypothetical protein